MRRPLSGLVTFRHAGNQGRQASDLLVDHGVARLFLGVHGIHVVGVFQESTRLLVTDLSAIRTTSVSPSWRVRSAILEIGVIERQSELALGRPERIHFGGHVVSIR